MKPAMCLLAIICLVGCEKALSEAADGSQAKPTTQPTTQPVQLIIGRLPSNPVPRSKLSDFDRSTVPKDLRITISGAGCIVGASTHVRTVFGAGHAILSTASNPITWADSPGSEPPRPRYEFLFGADKKQLLRIWQYMLDNELFTVDCRSTGRRGRTGRHLLTVSAGGVSRSVSFCVQFQNAGLFAELQKLVYLTRYSHSSKRAAEYWKQADADAFRKELEGLVILGLKRGLVEQCGRSIAEEAGCELAPIQKEIVAILADAMRRGAVDEALAVEYLLNTSGAEVVPGLIEGLRSTSAQSRDLVLKRLKEETGQDLGADYANWRRWWDNR